MQNAGSILERLRRVIPQGVEPKFKSAAELMEWQREEGRKHGEQVERQNQVARSEKIMGRSGIQTLHRSCTFSNYLVENDGQRHAYTLAKSYANNFGRGFTGFIFSGAPGTGKNHLPAAIGNHLLNQGLTVLVVTVSDLMLRVRACYDGGESESTLIDELCKVDLLIIDEVGMQRETKNEQVILNQIIDRRLAALKPVGVLTNLNHAELTRVLGVRVMDRLQMDDGLWVNFTWESYRKNVSHLRLVK